MSQDQKLLEAIELIYGASTCPAQWTSVLDFLEEYLSLMCCQLTMVSNQTNLDRYFSSKNNPEFAFEAYRDHFINVDPFVIPALSSPDSVIYTREELVPTEQWLKTEYYNDFANPSDVTDGMFVVFGREGNEYCSLSTWRDQHLSEFSKHDVKKLEPLVPHLRRSVEISRKLNTLRAERDATADGLDTLTCGAVFFDSRGQIIAMNRAAQDLVAANDGLLIDREGLRCRSLTANDTMWRLIGEATKTNLGNEASAAGNFAVPRFSGKRPLTGLVAPLPHRSNAGELYDVRVTAVLILTDPELQPASPADVFHRFYKLTPREIQLAEIIATGIPLDQAADVLGIATTTARVHLRTIFAKLGVNSQSQLIRLFYASALPCTSSELAKIE